MENISPNKAITKEALNSENDITGILVDDPNKETNELNVTTPKTESYTTDASDQLDIIDSSTKQESASTSQEESASSSQEESASTSQEETDSSKKQDENENRNTDEKKVSEPSKKKEETDNSEQQ